MALPPDTPPSAGVWDTLVIYGGLIGAWIVGESGRAAIAGATGGLVRWLVSEKRHLRSGVLSVVVGAFMSQYATPLMLALLEKSFGELRGEVGNTGAFFTGIVGMSMAKLVIAYIEARGDALSKNGASDG